MNIMGRQVTLRAIELDDVEVVHRWSNDPEVQGNLGGWHFPLSKAALAKWISGFTYDGRDQRFIVDHHTEGAVGIAALTDINWKDRNAFHGLLIGERTQRRQGLGADVVIAIMRYAFEELGLQRLDTTIVEFNLASMKLHEQKCGWAIEGRKEAAVFRRNRYWALNILGITAEAYAEKARSGSFADYHPAARQGS
jgi:RimJ/RimL family protein N-acetyltransferase